MIARNQSGATTVEFAIIGALAMITLLAVLVTYKANLKLKATKKLCNF